MSRKKGVQSYRDNPFLTPTTAIATRRKRVVVSGGKAIVDTATGEYEDVAEIVMVKQVDAEQFVKVFTQNLKVFFDLTPITMKLLQVLLSQVQGSPNQDRVMLNLTVMQDYFTRHDDEPMSKASFHRAVRELIDKQFIAETMLAGLYFINPNLFFNGDRVRFMTEIRKAKNRDLAEEQHEQLVKQMKVGFVTSDDEKAGPEAQLSPALPA